MNEIKPLPAYKDFLYYSGLITFIGIGLIIYLIIKNNVSSNLMIPSIFLAFIFGGLTYYIWETRCPNCKKPFAKTEKHEWKENLETKQEPYTYYSKMYKYQDGTIEPIQESKTTILRNKKYEKHYYICKKCNKGKDKEWAEIKWIWLGDEPKVQYIEKKGSSKEKEFYFNKRSIKKIRKPIKRHLKKELFERADNACQHCGHTFGLDLHHIDENRANDNKNNLIVLCANCHRMVKGINKIALKNEALKSYKKSKTIHIYK